MHPCSPINFFFLGGISNLIILSWRGKTSVEKPKIESGRITIIREIKLRE